MAISYKKICSFLINIERREKMIEIIGSIICGVIALLTLWSSIRSFQEKGFLFNNAYIWASQKEREKMDKSPHYRQTAIVFLFLTIIFLCMAAEFILQTGWMWIVNVVIAIAAVVYAIASSIKIEKHMKK